MGTRGRIRDDLRTVVWTYDQIKTSNKWLLITLSLTTIIGALHITRAALIRNIVNKLSLNEPVFSWEMLGAAILLLSISSVSIYLLDKAVGNFAGIGANEFKLRIASRLPRLKMEDAEKLQFGDLVSTYNTDTEQIQILLRQTCTSFVSQPLIGISAATYLFYIHPALFSVCLMCVPFGMYIAGYLNRRMGMAALLRSDSLGKMLAHVGDTIRGIEIVKSYNRESTFARRNAELSDEVLRHDLSLERNHSLMQPACLGLARIPGALLLLAGGRMIFAGRFDIGALIAAADLLALVLGPVVWFPFMMNGVKRACGSVGRIRKFLELPVEPMSGEEMIAVENKPVVEFENVRFSYSGVDRDKPVLQDICFDLPANTILSIIGESGAGKSTIGDLICGLYRDYSGSIRLLGNEISELNPLALRRYISVVSQRVEFFPGTIRENITGHIMSGSGYDERLEAAARGAGIHRFVERLPAGYDSPVSERGAGFSGGERLRLSIARALYRDSPLLILDEPTAAMDCEAEKDLVKMISGLKSGRSILLISHRPTTYEIADNVIVLEEGRIIERGMPRELLSSNGSYTSLYSNYTCAEAPNE